VKQMEGCRLRPNASATDLQTPSHLSGFSKKVNEEKGKTSGKFLKRCVSEELTYQICYICTYSAQKERNI
jgi:hypothetical protein